MLGRDLRILEARLGEHERLRVDRHSELLQHRAQIAVLRLIDERSLPVLEMLLEFCDRIAQVV